MECFAAWHVYRLEEEEEEAFKENYQNLCFPSLGVSLLSREGRTFFWLRLKSICLLKAHSWSLFHTAEGLCDSHGGAFSYYAGFVSFVLMVLVSTKLILDNF